MPGVGPPIVVPTPLLEPYEQLDILGPSSPDLYKPVTVQGGVWSEKVDNISPGIDAISVDASSSTLQIEVPWSQRSSIMSRCLGYQYVSGTSLKRVLPLAHPYFEFMRCRRITRAVGIAPRGDGPIEPVDLGPAFPRPYFANYCKIRLDLVFETMPFKFKTDQEVTHEYERYCYVRTEPGYDSLFVHGEAFKFDSNVGTDFGDKGVNAFSGGRNFPIAVGQVLCTWYDVPLEYLQYQSIYKNINFAIGKINSQAIFGYPKYTLLMDTPQIELRPNPLPPDISTDVTYLANVTFRFHYLEPLPLGSGVSINLGHNMAFYAGERKWYPASLANKGDRKPDNSTRPYQTWDMGKLFDMPTAATLTPDS